MSPKLTVIDSQIAGISGDMLLGALIDAGATPETVHTTLKLIPQHFPRCESLRLQTREVRKHGFRACLVDFTISERDEETRAEELIDTAHEIAKASNLGDRAKSFAVAAIQVLTDVESKLHGVEISKTHLHEAGSTDTLADIFGEMDAQLSKEKITTDELKDKQGLLTGCEKYELNRAIA